MNFEYFSELIMSHLYSNYTTTPYRMNGADMLIDPTDSNKAKTLDEIEDFIEMFITFDDSSRKILNGNIKGRWVSGAVRFNAYDQKATGNTKINGVRTDQLLGILDGIFSEQTIENVNCKITFSTFNGANRIGFNEDLQRFEGFSRVRVQGILK